MCKKCRGNGFISMGDGIAVCDYCGNVVITNIDKIRGKLTLTDKATKEQKMHKRSTNKKQTYGDNQIS